MNKYIDYQQIQSYNCYLIKCNNMVLLFKYLNDTFFLIIENTLLSTIKRNSMHNIVNQLNINYNYKNNLILITINQYILIIATHMLLLLSTP